MASTRSKTRTWAPRALAAAFLTSGVVHMVKPDVFTPLVPASLPSPTGIVYVSGVAELICARRAAGPHPLGRAGQRRRPRRPCSPATCRWRST